MLKAKRLGTPLFPIFHHALVHATLQLLILKFIVDVELAFIAFLIQLTTHFLIDVWKGRMNGWFPKLQDPMNPYHWYIFGFDQFLHQLVLIGISLLLFIH